MPKRCRVFFIREFSGPVDLFCAPVSGDQSLIETSEKQNLDSADVLAAAMNGASQSTFLQGIVPYSVNSLRSSYERAVKVLFRLVSRCRPLTQLRT